MRLCGPAPPELEDERIVTRFETSFPETGSLPHSIAVAGIVALLVTNTCLILPGTENKRFTRGGYQNA